MAIDYIIHSFGSGEMSPKLYFRGDFEKYELGAALCRNWYIDYRGGASTRPGTSYVVPFQKDDKAIKCFEFQFSPDAANSYIVVMGDEYIRFVQNDGYVLEASKVITNIVQTTSITVTSNAHGFANGDWVFIDGLVTPNQLNSNYFWVKNVTANTFTLNDSVGNPVLVPGFAGFSGAPTVSRAYTVVSPYDATDLDDLRTYQSRNELRITSLDYKARTLTRIGHTNWTLSFATTVLLPARPATPSAAASAAGSAGVAYCITAVDALGQESLPTRTQLELNIVNYTVVAGSITFTWAIASDAVSYNVYRSKVLSDQAKVHSGMDLGYIGSTLVPEFTDENIVPDFTKIPPALTDPFADGAIEAIEITASGSGYTRTTNATTFSITTSTGSGFIGFPVVNGAGEVIGSKIISGGQNYLPADTISIVDSGVGTGATAMMTVGDNAGNNPSLSLVHDQRQIYAATSNDPLTVFGSQIKLFKNFNSSSAQNDDESFEYELDSQEVTPILHMATMATGLMIMTSAGVWLMNGGNADTAITPKKAKAKPQSFIGSSETVPLRVGEDILYVDAVGSSIRMMSLSQYTENYHGEDISILSNHFFTNANFVENWAYASDPGRLVWGVRSDGSLLCLTIVREHKILAWTLHTTKGNFLQALSMREGKTNAVYLQVQRKINGRSVKYLEKLAVRDSAATDTEWALDCGSATALNKPASTLTFSGPTGEVTATSTPDAFTAAMVGGFIRAGTGRALIKSFTNSSTVVVEITSPLELEPETDIPRTFASGTWSANELFSQLSGLGYLEGQTVTVFGDGVEMAGLTVVDGKVTLPRGVSFAIVGLPYRCILRTLPPSVVGAVIEDKLKRVAGLAFRTDETYGLKTGERLDELDEIKWEPSEFGGATVNPFSGMKDTFVDGRFTVDGQVYFVQDAPFHASILGYVLQLDLGDVDP